MATTPQHTFVRHEWDRFQMGIAGATAINQGDNVFAGADGRALPMSAASALQYAGVAEDTNPVTSLLDQLSEITVVRRGTFRFKTTVGDVYDPGEAVYGGADAQTVTVTSSGATKVGYVSPNQAGNPNALPITGAAGVSIDVIIEPQWPATTV